MNARGGALLTVLGVLGGCVYYNSIYNAQRLYDSAERERLAGRDSVAAGLYGQVVAKAARGFRKDPSGEWAGEALSLIGRAHLRLGDLRAARAALEEAGRRVTDPHARGEVEVYLGATLVSTGEVEAGVAALNQAIQTLHEGSALGDGHLWRGRVLLGLGEVDTGWWDLDRAVEADSRLRVPAALERIRWGLRYGDLPHTREGVRLILNVPEGGARRDTVSALLEGVAERWGPEVAADLLAGADTSDWSPRARGDVLLDRARFRRAAGDTAGAAADVRGVSSGIGVVAAEARLLRVRWLLGSAPSLSAVYEAIPVLLPVQDEPAAARVLRALRAVAALADPSLPETLALFAAAELARDELGAPVIARGLFLAYAQIAPEAAWAPKALLAAMELMPAGEERERLRLRLEQMDASPYVLAARGEASPGLEALEDELARRMDQVLRQVAPAVARGRSDERGGGATGRRGDPGS